MISPAGRQYATRAAWIAGMSGALAIAAVALVAPGGLVWALAGWILLSLIGIAGGVGLVQGHGTPGVRFVVVMGTAMILRSIVALALLVAALRTGGGAFAPCLAGLVAGFLPQQVFEIVWFGRIRRPQDGRREPTREA